MELGERKAFDAILGEVFAAIDKPLGEAKTEAFWKGLQKMSILDMARIRDDFLKQLETSEPPKTLSVSDFWSMKRKLRAKGPVNATPANFEAALEAEIAHLTANDKPDRAAEFAALIRQSVRNWEERRRANPEKWANDLRIAKLDRIIATEPSNSPAYDRALCEWREARGIHVGPKEWKGVGGK